MKRIPNHRDLVNDNLLLVRKDLDTGKVFCQRKTLSKNTAPTIIRIQELYKKSQGIPSPVITYIQQNVPNCEDRHKASRFFDALRYTNEGLYL
jgi:hypothetical protein